MMLRLFSTTGVFYVGYSDKDRPLNVRNIGDSLWEQHLAPLTITHNPHQLNTEGQVTSSDHFIFNSP